MPNTQRIGDQNNVGGVITTSPNTSVYADNKIIAVDGSMGTTHITFQNKFPSCNPPINPHCATVWTTANGGPTVFAENLPINKNGDFDTCGHYRTGGSSTVFNDAFQGGGAMFDNNPPYRDTPPMGAQPSPPAGYENNTTATIYVYEFNDTEDDTGNGPPSGTNYAPLSEVESEVLPETVYTPTTSLCYINIQEGSPPFDVNYNFADMPDNFNWIIHYPTSLIGPGSPNPTFEEWASNTPLSPNFTVWDFCNGAVGQYEFTTEVNQASGLTQKEILINMCHHANSVLEPLLTLYGPFTITSGFRNVSGTSQHNKGQATDIQYLGFHTTDKTYEAKMGVRQAYYDRAKQIRDNIEFDQLILEYYAINPWLHISSNPLQHRGKINTQISETPSYASGLILLG